MFKIKNQYKEWYKQHDSFVMRNPLFPVESLFKWHANQESDIKSSEDMLRRLLYDFYLQPIAREALYVGSPDLHEQLLLLTEKKIDKQDKKEKAELSLAKYMIRICSRCTPYGLFASCTTGAFSDYSAAHLTDKLSLTRYGRLDMDYVGQVFSHLLSNREINDQFCFFPNTSLYPLGDNYRYIEHRFTKEAGRSYHLVQIEKSEYLENILSAAANGCRPCQLAATITNDDISSEEAAVFVQELIKNQVLVSELEPNVTGREYFSILTDKLKSIARTEKYVTQFQKAAKEFEQINSGPEVSKNKYYSQIVLHLKELDIPVHLKTLIQVDSYRSARNCTLNSKVGDDILYGASLLHLLSTADSKRDTFSDFKVAFISRYEQQWVPLVEALDTEAGIGYGKFATSSMEESPLINMLPLWDNKARGANQMPDAESFKWQLYQEAILKNKTEVTITDHLIEQLSKKEFSPKSLPDSFFLMAKIHASSSADIDSGNYTITMHTPTGPSGGNLLGRFCHLHPDIEKLTRSVLQNEEAHMPDSIFAEIVHLPESRIGNILMRPVLREYEIPYLCGSTLGKEFQVAVADLLVGIDDNKILLRSKRLNKQVIPRMTTAHNFSMTTLPVYQFLCDLQFQNITTAGWSWGVLENRPFLPRVSYEKYILSKARWVMTKAEVKDCFKKDSNELYEKFSEVVKGTNLPRYVLLSQGDNELLLDLKNIYCIKLLLSAISKYENVKLTETLDMPGQCWIESPDGHHAGEFIFAFTKNGAIPVSLTAPLVQKKQKDIKRYFPVGSAWLYAKIYCGTKTAEKILTDKLKPFTLELLSEGLIDKYFFLRYQDRGSHIRIRFHHSSNKDFWKEVISRLQVLLQPYTDNHSVYNLQFETYQREVERYGFDTMEMSEDIFYYHSVATLHFISMLEGDEGEHYRWQVTLKALDFVLDDFGYSTLRKRELIKTLHSAFSTEFNVLPPQQREITERFSINKRIIQQLMSEEWKTDENLRQAITIFKISDEGYRKAIKDILSSSLVKGDIQKLDYLMHSYLHLFINRMFINSQRKVELVIYDYLLKHYESKIAREKYKKTAPDLAT
ncbi:MAG TPA: lantibiotic dehydratase [Puia sp.]|nr:lantibiotic dehydratase [Puia sp.]